MTDELRASINKDATAIESAIDDIKSSYPSLLKHVITSLIGVMRPYFDSKLVNRSELSAKILALRIKFDGTNYGKAVNRYIELYDVMAENFDEYHQVNGHDFDEDSLNEYVISAQRNIRSLLLGEELNARLVVPIKQEILRQSYINKNMDRLEQSMKDSVLSDVHGRVASWMNRVVENDLYQFVGSINQNVFNSLKLPFFYYLGVEDDISKCKEYAGEVRYEAKDIGKMLSSLSSGERDFFIYRGGNGCTHIIFPSVD